MAKIKSYTDLQQSKVLAEILPLESADIIYTMVNGYHTPFIRIETIEEIDEDDVLSWSLVALLSVLPKNINIGRPSLESNYKGYYWIQYYDEFMKPNKYKTGCFNNPVDACYELILKLHELKML